MRWLSWVVALTSLGTVEAQPIPGATPGAKPAAKPPGKLGAKPLPGSLPGLGPKIQIPAKDRSGKPKIEPRAPKANLASIADIAARKLPIPADAKNTMRSSGLKERPRPPSCTAFDQCVSQGGGIEKCCGSQLKHDERSCAMCKKAACIVRADVCSHMETAPYDKYCPFCHKLGQAEASPPPATPAPVKQAPKKPIGSKPSSFPRGPTNVDPGQQAQNQAQKIRPGAKPLEKPFKGGGGMASHFPRMPGLGSMFGSKDKAEVKPKAPPPKKPKAKGPGGSKLPFNNFPMGAGTPVAKNKWNEGPMAQAMAKAKAQIQQRQGKDRQEV